MPLYDSHAHFGAFDAAGDLDRVIRRAREAGLGGMTAVGGTARDNDVAVRLSTDAGSGIRAAVGYDRDQADPARAERGTIDPAGIGTAIEGYLAGCGRIVAIGEIGLDYHYGAHTAAGQRALFEAQLRLASDLQLPVIVHSREAESDTVALLKKYSAGNLRADNRAGVVHCFTGTPGFAAEIVELGFCLGFAGIVTFRGAEMVRKLARETPEDRLLIETDSPYLAPEPHRGKINEPALLRHVAAAMASIRDCSDEDIAEITTANAERLFGIQVR